MLLLVGSGCLANAPNPGSVEEAPQVDLVPSALRVADDAAGDARVYSPETLRSFLDARKCSLIPGAVRPTCAETVSSAFEAFRPPSEHGVAEPALDVLSATFNETREHLLVEIRVASVDAALTGVAAANGDWAGGWRTCWVSAGQVTTDWAGWPRTECAYLHAARNNGVVVLESSFERDVEGCNDWSWCWWGVPHSIAYGTPATLRIAIPRSILDAASPADPLTEIRVGSYRTLRPGGSYADYASAYLGVPGVHEESPSFWNRQAYPTDESDGSGSYTFQTPSVIASPEPARHWFADEEGEAAPDVDATLVEFVERERHFTASFRIARVDASPANHVFWAAFGMPSGRVHQVGYRVQDGRTASYAGACADASCSQWNDHAVEIERAPGVPGWVNLTFSRADLGAPARGGLITVFSASLSHATLETPAGPAALTAPASAWVGSLADELQPSPPFRFRLDTATD